MSKKIKFNGVAPWARDLRSITFEDFVNTDNPEFCLSIQTKNVPTSGGIVLNFNQLEKLIECLIEIKTSASTRKRRTVLEWEESNA